MWTGWLPSRPIQWNDINGRINLGNTGAAIDRDRPIVVNNWPSAGALGYQARANGSAIAPGSLMASDASEKHGEIRGENGAKWGLGASSRSKLVGTSDRAGMGAGAGGHGGAGLGTPSGVRFGQRNGDSGSKAKAAGTSSRSNGPRARSGGAPSPVPPSENSTTVGDLATGTGSTGIGGLDLGFGNDLPGGGGSGMAATPEPASIMLIGTGVLALAGIRRRRRK
jgi:hypothetical protein